MPILDDVQINDLAVCLSEQYQDDPIDQTRMYDSLVETITEWSESYGEHPPKMYDEPLPDTEVDDSGLIYIELGKDDC